LRHLLCLKSANRDPPERKYCADGDLLGPPIDGNYRYKNPFPALGFGVQANQAHDLFDVLDDPPGSIAQLLDVLIARPAEIDDDR
jgi:hypothetical protein